MPLFQSESKCETVHMKMSSACSFFFMQIKVIFITMVSHLDSRKWPIHCLLIIIYSKTEEANDIDKNIFL